MNAPGMAAAARGLLKGHEQATPHAAADVEAFCRALRPIEDRCYLERRFNDRLLPLAKEHHVLGLPVPAEFGGRGVSNAEYVEHMARIAREGTAVRTFFSGHSSLGQKTVAKFGSDAVKGAYLRPSAVGDVLFAFALTEPEAGSDPRSLKAVYEPRGDAFVLNGKKFLITNGTSASALVVFAKDARGRIAAFVVDAASPGLVREEMTGKMGLPTIHTGQFELKNVRVPAEHLLGDAEAGWRIAKYGLMNGRLSVAAGCVGVILDCLEEAAAYAKGRVQHGKQIARHQLIQEHLARMKVVYEAARLMVGRAAALLDAYEQSGAEDDRRRADTAIAEAKYFGANAAWEAADRAVQVLGGRGWFFQYRPARHLVDTRVCRIYEGTDEILLLRIAEGYLGGEFAAYS